MSKRVITIITIIIMLMCSVILHIEHNYTMTDCVVVEASDKGALIEDTLGNQWYWEKEGFEVGDIVVLEMHDHFSSTYVADDIIKEVKR